MEKEQKGCFKYPSKKNQIKRISSISEISQPNETKSAAHSLIFREPANLIDPVSTHSSKKKKKTIEKKSRSCFKYLEIKLD